MNGLHSLIRFGQAVRAVHICNSWFQNLTKLQILTDADILQNSIKFILDSFLPEMSRVLSIKAYTFLFIFSLILIPADMLAYSLETMFIQRSFNGVCQHCVAAGMAKFVR